MFRLSLFLALVHVRSGVLLPRSGSGVVSFIWAFSFDVSFNFRLRFWISPAPRVRSGAWQYLQNFQHRHRHFPTQGRLFPIRYSVETDDVAFRKVSAASSCFDIDESCVFISFSSWHWWYSVGSCVSRHLPTSKFFRLLPMTGLQVSRHRLLRYPTSFMTFLHSFLKQYLLTALVLNPPSPRSLFHISCYCKMYFIYTN